MNVLLWVYLIGFAAMIVMQHGIAQNQNCLKAKASDAVLAAIIWPVQVVVAMFRTRD